MRSFSRLQSERYSDIGRYKVFDDKKAIFVHIPKCAGTAVAKAIFSVEKVSHRSIKEYQLIFSKADFDSYFKFTFVRNPWDRVVSAYSYLKQGLGTEGDKQFSEKYLSDFKNFDHFVKEGLRDDKIFNRHHFRPQYKYVTLPGDEKILVDEVYRVEDMFSAMADISGKLNIPKSNIGKENSSNRESYLKYYNEETIGLVRKFYETDIRLFGYKYLI